MLLACFLLPSCTSKAVLRDRVLNKPLADDYLARIANIRKEKKKLYGKGVKNAFLYNMDIGVLFHYAGMYDSSNVYLLEAERIFDDLFARSLTNEAASLLTNDNVRPYRSKPYELTMVHQFAALNFMAMGKFDDALVESRRMQIYFNEWKRAGAAEKKYHTDGMFHLLSALAYERVGEPDNSLISTYNSVDAFKKGPVPLAEEVEGFAYDRFMDGDREDDVNTLGLRPLDGPNKWTAKMGDAEIVIVGYVGKGPVMIERDWRGTMMPGGGLYISASKRDRNGQEITYSALAPPLPYSYRNNRRAWRTHHLRISLPELLTTPSGADRFSARLSGGSQTYWSVDVEDIDKQAGQSPLRRLRRDSRQNGDKGDHPHDSRRADQEKRRHRQPAGEFGVQHIHGFGLRPAGDGGRAHVLLSPAKDNADKNPCGTREAQRADENS